MDINSQNVFCKPIPGEIGQLQIYFNGVGREDRANTQISSEVGVHSEVESTSRYVPCYTRQPLSLITRDKVHCIQLSGAAAYLH